MQDQPIAADRSPAAARCVVTCIDAGEPLADCLVGRAPRVDLSRPNLKRVIALLDEREGYWNAAEASPEGRSSTYERWSMAALMSDLPQGWEPAINALFALPDQDRLVWDMPRATKPMLESIAEAWDLCESVQKRRALGERVQHAEVSAAVEGMQKAVELKWRLGHLTHCGEEFTMLASLLAVTHPKAASRYARLAAGCSSRLASAAPTSVETPPARWLDGSERLPDATGSHQTAAAFVEEVNSNSFKPEAWFLNRSEDGRTIPIGPFEPIWTSAPRTGIQQMMDGSRQPIEHASFVVWTFSDRMWSVEMMQNHFECCLWQARSNVASARRANVPYEPAASAIRFAVMAMEAFVIQLLDFIVMEGREAWPSEALKPVHDNVENFKKIGGLTRQVEKVGDRIVGANWLAPNLRSGLEGLAAQRNQITHPKGAIGRTLTGTTVSPRIHCPIAREWAATLEFDGGMAIELAARSVECVEAVVAALRGAYAERYQMPPAEPPVPPPGAPRAEMILFEDGPNGLVFIPGFTLPASSLT